MSALGQKRTNAVGMFVNSGDCAMTLTAEGATLR